MPYNIRKRSCRQSSGKKGSYVLSYTDNKGKKHSNCHTSRKRAKGQIAAIEAESVEPVALRSLVREFVEFQQATEAMMSLAPWLANYLDGLISASDTKEQVLSILQAVKRYRNRIPGPVFKAMDIVVPGFRSFEHFEDRVMMMSEDELDNRLGRLLVYIQAGRLTGMMA
jgi:hypothetical protein